MTNLLLAADYEFADFGEAFSALTEQLFPVLITIFGALAVLWGIFLGWKTWKAAGDENKAKEAKKAIFMFVIGIFVMFIVVVGAPILISALSAWAKNPTA